MRGIGGGRKTAPAAWAAAALLLVTLAGGAQGAPPGEEPAVAVTPADPVSRGAYLVQVSGCHDCHTPMKAGPDGPVPDLSRALSGHPQDQPLPPPPHTFPQGPWSWVIATTNTAFAGPWGVSYASNLTPDPETGIGGWDEERFVRVMTTGRHHAEKRPLMPPMPWRSFARFTRQDLAAIFAYLKSLPPIRNRVPDYAPPATAP